MIIELEKSIRPIFKGYSANKEFKILFDTGAETSVYTRSEGIFLQRFPYAKKLECKSPIGGFGDGNNLCPVYQIPELRIGDLVIKNVPVAICAKKNITSEIVLASCVFYYIPFTINLEEMQMIIYPKRDNVSCLCKTTYSDKYKCNVLTGTYVLTQEDIN